MSYEQKMNEPLRCDCEEKLCVKASAKTSKKNVRFEIEEQHEYDERRNAIEFDVATLARKAEEMPGTLGDAKIYGLRLLDNYERVEPRELAEADRVAYYANLTKEWNTVMAMNEPILVPLPLLTTAEDQVRALMQKVDSLQQELDVANTRVEMLEGCQTATQAAPSSASSIREATSEKAGDATAEFQLPEHDGPSDDVGNICGCCCEVVDKLAMKCHCGGVLCDACYRDLIDDGTITCQTCFDVRDVADQEASALEEPLDAPSECLDKVCDCCCEVVDKVAMTCHCGGILCEACFSDLIDDGTITCQSCFDVRDVADEEASALEEPVASLDATNHLDVPSECSDKACDCCAELPQKLGFKCGCGAVLCEMCYSDLIDDGTITCQSCFDVHDVADDDTAALEQVAPRATPVANCEVTAEHIVVGALKERDQFDALGDYARCCDAIDLMTDLIPGATKKLAPMLTVDETIVSKNVTNAVWRLLSTVAYWSP